MTGSTSEIARSGFAPPEAAPTGRRLVLPLIVGAIVVAALTVLVFLMRAGGDPGDAASWPITWELRSSDNGTLVQFWADVAAGRPLDWSFSPQVYAFPEVPLSGLAFLASAGDVYVYYVVVAVLNQVAVFLLLAALARALWPSSTPLGVVLRAGAGVVPLLLLPLVGTTWVWSFHLAPTYYIGMYLALLAAPLVLLVRSRVARLLLALGLALTIASNPLTVLFAAPGLLGVLLARLARSGRGGLGRPALMIGGIAAGAVVARAAFSPLQGTGLLTYVDLDVFRSRVDALWPYWSFQLIDPAARVLLPLGAILALGCLVVAVGAGVLLARRTELDERRAFATVFFGLVPLGGLAATVAALITHYYYFWPVLVLPFVLALFALPARFVEPAVLAAAVAFVAVGVSTGGVANLATAGAYFGYRSPETRCLDRVVPGEVGFATFSDARRVGLPSASGVRLIPVTADLAPNLWLTNRAYARLESGTFLYVNERGDERAIDGDAIAARFGDPDRTVTCADGQRVLIYDRPLSVAG